MTCYQTSAPVSPDRLKSSKIAQVVCGVFFLINAGIWTINYEQYIFLGIDLFAGVYIIIAGLFVCCPPQPASYCRVRTHMVLAISICPVLLLFGLYYGIYFVGRISGFFIEDHSPVLPAFSFLYILINFILFLWSSVSSGKVNCSPNPNNQPQSQTIYIQRQAAPMQQVVYPMQPPQRYYVIPPQAYQPALNNEAPCQTQGESDPLQGAAQEKIGKTLILSDQKE